MTAADDFAHALDDGLEPYRGLNAALARTGEGHSAEKDVHAGCLTAWEQERTKRQFVEARLNSLIIELRHLAQAMDGISGHTAHERLGGKTLGGAVRFVADGEPAPRVTSPAARGFGLGPDA